MGKFLCAIDRSIMKQSECAKRKISTVMGEWKRKKLKSHNKRVKNYKQAIAIALSEARRYCGNKSVGKRSTEKRSSGKRKRRSSRKRSKH